MTARVTTLKGGAAGEYYVEHLPSYYLDSGEPRGRWHGTGAQLLGLTGEVDDEDFLALMAGRNPQRPSHHLGRRYGDDSVRGFDVTASAPKSVSVLFAVGDPTTRSHVLAAHDTAVATMVDWIERHAHTRRRINGDIVVVDADGIIAATFRQHTSRALDPQLHTHVVIANRVRASDGRWLALDARTLKFDQRTLSAVYHASLRTELTRRLGVAWHEPANGIAEIANVDDAILERFSTRTRGIQRRIDAKLDRFTDTYGRDPTQRERWKLEREAVVESRPSKTHAFDAPSLHDTWANQLGDLGFEPAAVVSSAVGRITAGSDIPKAQVKQMVDGALESLGDKQSTWRAAELVRELLAQVPTSLGVNPAWLIPTIDELARKVIEHRCVDLSPPIPPGVPLRRDGRPITESVADRILTTPQILAQEERLIAWAERRLLTPQRPSRDAVRRSPHVLTAGQADTAGVVAGHGDLMLIVGPAGTGKTTALAPAVEQLRAEGRVVFGVAPSAAAAKVLADETGVAADTVDKLLVEHARGLPDPSLRPAGRRHGDRRRSRHDPDRQARPTRPARRHQRLAGCARR